MNERHPIQERRKRLENFPNARLFSTYLGHKTTWRVNRWEAGYESPPDDEITKMAKIFKVSHETLETEINEWNRNRPDLFELVTEWRRIKSPEQNGLGPILTEPQNSRGLGSSLPSIPDGIKPEDRESYLKWLENLGKEEAKHGQ